MSGQAAEDLACRLSNLIYAKFGGHLAPLTHYTKAWSQLMTYLADGVRQGRTFHELIGATASWEHYFATYFSGRLFKPCAPNRQEPGTGARLRTWSQICKNCRAKSRINLTD